MTLEAFHAAALALPGARLDIKWGEDRIYCVGEKMFAAAGSIKNPVPRYSFKTSPMAFEGLIEQGLATPAPYLARARWVALTHPDALPDAALIAYLGQAHAMVAAGLTKKKRVELGIS